MKKILNYLLWLPFAVSISSFVLYFVTAVKIKLKNTFVTESIQNTLKMYLIIGLISLFIGLLIVFVKKVIKLFKTDNNVKEIKKIIKGKKVVLAGQSGAGKSSLLNRLDKNLSLETNEISKALGRGKHTTRCVTLYEVDGALIADTPGFSSVDFRGMTKLDIRDNMKEMFDGLHYCKYRDCMHIKEDGCYIKETLEKGNILPSRYNNYKSFIGGK